MKRDRKEEPSKDVENLVERKLHRIYVYLERENEGLVSADMVNAIIRRITKRRKRRSSLRRLFTSKLQPSMTRANSELSEGDPGSSSQTRRRSKSVVVRTKSC